MRRDQVCFWKDSLGDLNFALLASRIKLQTPSPSILCLPSDTTLIEIFLRHCLGHVRKHRHIHLVLNRCPAQLSLLECINRRSDASTLSTGMKE